MLMFMNHIGPELDMYDSDTDGENDMIWVNFVSLIVYINICANVLNYLELL